MSASGLKLPSTTELEGRVRPSGYLMSPPRFSPSRPGFLHDRILKAEVQCFACKKEAEPGRIETDNNGPIVDCLMCIERPRRILEDGRS